MKNKDTPNIGNPTEEKENEMEEFIDYAKIVMGALGYKLFEPYDKQENEQEDPEPKPDEEPLLYLDRKITDADQYMLRAGRRMKASSSIKAATFRS